MYFFLFNYEGVLITLDTKGWSVVCVCDISWAHVLVYVEAKNEIRSFHAKINYVACENKMFITILCLVFVMHRLISKTKTI